MKVRRKWKPKELMLSMVKVRNECIILTTTVHHIKTTLSTLGTLSAELTDSWSLRLSSSSEVQSLQKGWSAEIISYLLSDATHMQHQMSVFFIREFVVKLR